MWGNSGSLGVDVKLLLGELEKELAIDAESSLKVELTLAMSIVLATDKDCFKKNGALCYCNKNTNKTMSSCFTKYGWKGDLYFASFFILRSR